MLINQDLYQAYDGVREYLIRQMRCLMMNSFHHEPEAAGGLDGICTGPDWGGVRYRRV